jgi:hypothetical protein
MSVRCQQMSQSCIDNGVTIRKDTGQLLILRLQFR